MAVLYVTDISPTPIVLNTIELSTQENTIMLSQPVLHLRIRPRKENILSKMSVYNVSGIT